MANSVDPVQTAPIGAVCSGSMLLASIPNWTVMHGKDFSRRHFQMHFFLGALRVHVNVISGLSTDSFASILCVCEQRRIWRICEYAWNRLSLRCSTVRKLSINQVSINLMRWLLAH